MCSVVKRMTTSAVTRWLEQRALIYRSLFIYSFILAYLTIHLSSFVCFTLAYVFN